MERGPSLKDSGGVVVAGEFGAWTPIGAEATGSGYEIAWKLSGSNEYTLWSVDANGDYVANLVGKVSGTDILLQSSEILFQQDLNGDGHIGLGTTTPIETKGATSLAAFGPAGLQWGWAVSELFRQ
jgi:serralysin